MSEESLKFDPRYKTKKQKGKGKADKTKVEEPSSQASGPAPVPAMAQEAKPFAEASFPQYPMHAGLANEKLHSHALAESSSPYEFLAGQSNVQSQAGTRNITSALGQSNPVNSMPAAGLLPGTLNSNALNSAPAQYYGNHHGNGRPLIDTVGLRPSRHNFQSMAVNMEYSIISNILTSSNQYNTIGQSDVNSSLSPSVNSANGEDSPKPKLDLYQQQQKQHLQVHPHHLHANPLNQFSLGSPGAEPSQNLSQLLETVEQINKQSTAHEWSDSTPKRPLSFTIYANTNEAEVHPVGRNGSTSSQSSAVSTNYPWQYREPADIYANVRHPYSYTPAYHQLTIYIRTRFKRDQQMRIARCMASYRPSFIACTNTLKEDDLIFMEQCFQRTLLEYEKFISYSGTPTLVWRRTGQVAAVGKEFCVLTGWPKERLLNEHTFVVELMDDSSALEYFEMFSKMAFGDSRGANMTECTLLTPQGQKIKTSSIWTLKRDVFGIPMMIVGNFLPILPNL